MSTPNPQTPRVGLFVTCLVDLFRPAVGFAAVKLLEEAGCEVDVPMAQTCCGRTASNDGDTEDTKALAKSTIEAFEQFDYVVAPSGSCAGMLKKHYPELIADDAAWAERAQAFSAKVYELTGFLVDVLGVSKISAQMRGSVTYHDACAGVSELGISRQPRMLISSIEGLELKEMADSQMCCGLRLSDTAASAPLTAQRIGKAGAGTVLAGDLGCLMSIAGKLKRQGSAIEVRHIAEVLAGMDDTPPIGGMPVHRNGDHAAYLKPHHRGIS